MSGLDILGGEMVMPELPNVGDEFAGYLLRSVLGRGHMGVVYEAENPRLGNVVALKVLEPELAADDTFRTRFLEETRIAASMNHPHVIPIHDMGSSDGLVYIAMHYVSGTDLRQMIAKRGRLQPETAVFLLSQAARALDAAHRMGLVHRDVKPENLLIERGNDDPGHVYLADFGFSKRGMPSGGLTSTEQFPGSVGYVAPEQIRGRLLYGSADQYSLGCVLYECLTGRVPFEKDLGAATVSAHAEEHFARPGLLWTDSPPTVDEVFAKALAEEPGDRYNTCREFMQAASVALDDVVLDDMATAPLLSGDSRALASEAEPSVYLAATAGYAAAQTPGDYLAEVAPAVAGYQEELTREAPDLPAGVPAEESTFAAVQPESPSGRLQTRWLVIAAVLLLACAGIGASAYAALSRSSASQAKAAAPTSSAMARSTMTHRAHVGPLMQVLTAADTSKGAMGKLPPSSCRQQGTTMVICTAPSPGIASATFTTYPTRTALFSAYRAEVKSLNSRHYRQNVKDCGLAAPSPYGEIAWNHQERHSRAYTIGQMIAGKVPVQIAMGRMACVVARHSEDIVWTTDYGKLLGVVIGNGSHTDVWYWWVAVHHNVVFPGTPMDMGSKAPLMSGAPMPTTSASGSPSMSPSAMPSPSMTASMSTSP